MTSSDASEDNGSTGNGGTKSDQRADQAMIYDSEGNGRLISEADDGNWYDSDGNYYGSWESSVSVPAVLSVPFSEFCTSPALLDEADIFVFLSAV